MRLEELFDAIDGAGSDYHVGMSGMRWRPVERLVAEVPDGMVWVCGAHWLDGSCECQVSPLTHSLVYVHTLTLAKATAQASALDLTGLVERVEA